MPCRRRLSGLFPTWPAECGPSGCHPETLSNIFFRLFEFFLGRLCSRCFQLVWTELTPAAKAIDEHTEGDLHNDPDLQGQYDITFSLKSSRMAVRIACSRSTTLPAPRYAVLVAVSKASSTPFSWISCSCSRFWRAPRGNCRAGSREVRGSDGRRPRDAWSLRSESPMPVASTSPRRSTG